MSSVALLMSLLIFLYMTMSLQNLCRRVFKMTYSLVDLLGDKLMLGGYAPPDPLFGRPLSWPPQPRLGPQRQVGCCRSLHEWEVFGGAVTKPQVGRSHDLPMAPLGRQASAIIASNGRGVWGGRSPEFRGVRGRSLPDSGGLGAKPPPGSGVRWRSPPVDFRGFKETLPTE